MSESSGSLDEDEGDQPKLTDFITRQCSICGRIYPEEAAPCHHPETVSFERQLATRDLLLSHKRPGQSSVNTLPIVGPDHVSFECTYLSLDSLINHPTEELEGFKDATPYSLPEQPWIASIYEDYLEKTDELILPLRPAITACESRMKQIEGDVNPPEVFAHLVYLDQFGLIPDYQRLDGGLRLRDFCADYYDVETSDLNSEWVTERRVDRTKVFSTTRNFRQEWNLTLVGRTPDVHPHSDCKPFDGTPVLGDHRDHNLMTKRAKNELSTLPDVDWESAPHIIYSRSGCEFEESSDFDQSRLPVLGFDFAGFEQTPTGQKLRYLGIVADWDEEKFEIYHQLIQIGKTEATGILILGNRESIYRFLHFLKKNRLISDTAELPENFKDYFSIPNTQTLHEELLSNISLFDRIALYPRRKLLDEGFQQIDELLTRETDA